MKTLKISSDWKEAIPLGHQGENLARQIIFDCADFTEQHGNGTAKLLYRRHGESTPYLAEVTQDGSTVTWPLTADDTARHGSGRLELRWYVGKTLAKSRVYITNVARSLTKPVDAPPEVEKTAIDLLTNAVNKLRDEVAADKIEFETLNEQARMEAEAASEAAATAASASGMAQSAADTAVNAKNLAQAAAEEAARSLVNADEAKSAAQTAADQARAFADTAAGYAGAATVSIGWDQDGFFSIFEQED